jgi:hypothetical protein
MRTVLISLLLLGLPAVIAAQTYLGQDANAPRTNAIAAGTAPGVAAANNEAAAKVAARDQAQAAASNADQAQHDADMRAYDAARRARRQVLRHDQAYYDREQSAYAAAMADWREQVAACNRGHTRACNAPSPRPGDYL